MRRGIAAKNETPRSGEAGEIEYRYAKENGIHTLRHVV
jgi:hypothetical protein